MLLGLWPKEAFGDGLETTSFKGVLGGIGLTEEIGRFSIDALFLSRLAGGTTAELEFFLFISCGGGRGGSFRLSSGVPGGVVPFL